MAFINVLTAVFIAFQAVVIKVWIAVTTVVITVFMAFHNRRDHDCFYHIQDCLDDRLVNIEIVVTMVLITLNTVSKTVFMAFHIVSKKVFMALKTVCTVVVIAVHAAGKEGADPCLPGSEDAFYGFPDRGEEAFDRFPSGNHRLLDVPRGRSRTAGSPRSYSTDR